jgi:hypothetical protein
VRFGEDKTPAQALSEITKEVNGFIPLFHSKGNLLPKSAREKIGSYIQHTTGLCEILLKLVRDTISREERLTLEIKKQKILTTLIEMEPAFQDEFAEFMNFDSSAA